MSQPNLVSLYNRFARKTARLLGIFIEHDATRLPQSSGNHDLCVPKTRYSGVYTVIKQHRKNTAIVTVHDLPTTEYDLIQSMAVVHIHCAWENFCRELVFISAYQQPVTAGGVRIKRVVKTRSDVIDTLKKKRGITRLVWEPPWHVPSECISAATHLGVGNLANITLGMSISGLSVIPDYLRYLRNFFAHHNNDTAIKISDSVVMPMGLKGSYSALELLNIRDAMGKATLEIWVEQLRIMARTAIQ
jgi:hypothetical protein